MIFGGPQVLADCENIHVNARQITKDPKQLVRLLAHADDDAGLCHLLWGQLFCEPQIAERTLVAAAGFRHTIEPRYRFDVVIQDLRPCRNDHADRLLGALKVRCQYLDLASRCLPADLLDYLHKGAAGTHVIVVAIHAGDHGVPQTQSGHGKGNPSWLIRVNRLGPAAGHGAETATPGAAITQHHEGGCFVVPALADIGAVGALAHGVQTQLARQLLQRVERLADRSARF